MIAYLSGKLLEKNVTSLIVDVGGVGYEVFVPLTTFYEVGEIGSMVSLRIYTHVREDSLQLYGFLHEKERQLFLKLISVQGISAKSGISILSSMNADELIKAILNKDITRLTAIPGVGRKTAERLTVELRDKLKNLATFEDGTRAKKVEFPEYEDVIAALVSLGYQKSVAESAVKEAMKEETEMDIKKLLRKSLQILSKV
ncbi:MAG: Holliday junction branch migration protein RuvA [Pyrinomonadaceae bacterium]|nr:Holliday junction branch migration protein RuvA [Pyrinomonadaceae bacterium]